MYWQTLEHSVWMQKLVSSQKLNRGKEFTKKLGYLRVPKTTLPTQGHVNRWIKNELKIGF